MTESHDLKNRAWQLAYEFEAKYGGCAQCVLAALKETIGGIPEEVFKSATGLAGGIGLQGYACGALTGGVLALSSYLGREYSNFADPQRVRFQTARMCEKLIGKFTAEYGSPNCAAIQTKLMDRSYRLSVPEDLADFLAAGGHDDKCTGVCGNSARWVIEILEEEGLLK